ncbi:MAG: hypothetical protein QOI36_5623, partial [Pseudonocardiales bacterium]|nr:hypothetical protein [Pseudonocardiales bacterium]
FGVIMRFPPIAMSVSYECGQSERNAHCSRSAAD